MRACDILQQYYSTVVAVSLRTDCYIRCCTRTYWYIDAFFVFGCTQHPAGQPIHQITRSGTDSIHFFCAKCHSLPQPVLYHTRPIYPIQYGIIIIYFAIEQCAA